MPLKKVVMENKGIQYYGGEKKKKRMSVTYCSSMKKCEGKGKVIRAYGRRKI